MEGMFLLVFRLFAPSACIFVVRGCILVRGMPVPVGVSNFSLLVEDVPLVELLFNSSSDCCVKVTILVRRFLSRSFLFFFFFVGECISFLQGYLTFLVLLFMFRGVILCVYEYVVCVCECYECVCKVYECIWKTIISV